MKNKTKQLVRELYKENGKPVELTDTQVEIFDLIWKKKHNRNHIMCFTRFGKSFTVALAVLTRAATFSEKWAIVAPSEKKARIIMSYIIEHTFDNDYTKNKLEYDKKESLERMRRERSKNRINFIHSDGTLGEIFILSADSRTKARAGDSLLGFGACNVIEDEAALIDDDIEAKIFRMLGDQTENFYFKIGNPFRRNHFLKDFRNPNFHKVNTDYQTGLKEGRITQEFIDEAKQKPYFDVLYENKFPPAEAIDDKGWSYLITDKELENSLDYIEEEAYIGSRTLGLDVARGGGNFNVWTMRTGNFATRLAKNQNSDLMDTVGNTIVLSRNNKIDMRNNYIDDGGIGGGVCDRLQEQRHYVEMVKLGAKADDETKFINRRAENFWRLKEWLNSGGKLDNTQNWTELLDIKYKADSAGRLKIMSKEEMQKNGIESPDEADSLMLTFNSPPYNPEFIRLQKEENILYDKYELI